MFNKDELDKLTKEIEQKYQKSYPGSIISIKIEPEPELIVFDGLMKEFSYQAIIEYK